MQRVRDFGVFSHRWEIFGMRNLYTIVLNSKILKCTGIYMHCKYRWPIRVFKSMLCLGPLYIQFSRPLSILDNLSSSFAQTVSSLPSCHISVHPVLCITKFNVYIYSRIHRERKCVFFFLYVSHSMTNSTVSLFLMAPCDSAEYTLLAIHSSAGTYLGQACTWLLQLVLQLDSVGTSAIYCEPSGYIPRSDTV